MHDEAFLRGNDRLLPYLGSIQQCILNSEMPIQVVKADIVVLWTVLMAWHKADQAVVGQRTVC